MKRLWVILFLTSVALAQDFQQTAKVVSSSVEEGNTTILRTPRRAVQQTYISTRAEIDGRVYTLAGGNSPLEPGEYPASIEKKAVLLQVKDSHGKPKTLKLHIMAIEAKS